MISLVNNPVPLTLQNAGKTICSVVIKGIINRLILAKNDARDAMIQNEISEIERKIALSAILVNVFFGQYVSYSHYANNAAIYQELRLKRYCGSFF